MMMNQPKAVGILASTVLAAMSWSAPAQTQAPKTSYPEMARAERYRIASREEEIALARTAAPPSVSGDAEVLVLGSHGYETAVKGKNGYVCFVERSWAAGFEDPEFWNPKVRSPNCFNPPAVRTELPQLLKRTEWALAGATREQLIEKTKAEFASGNFRAPEGGAYSFMLSKESYLNDAAAGPWLPHIMLFLPKGHADNWGTNIDGSPISSDDRTALESTLVYIPVRTWFDGSPAPPPKKH